MTPRLQVSIHRPRPKIHRTRIFIQLSIPLVVEYLLSIAHHHCHWSDLPTDLLELVAAKLSFPDFFSLKRVCSSWRVATKPINIPLLSFLSTWESGKSKIDAKVFFLGLNKGRPNIEKATPLCLQERDSYCDVDKVLGSHPDGWLVLKHKDGHYFLLELLSHVRIDFPRITKNSSEDDDWSHKAVLSDNPNCRQDFIVILLYGNIHRKKIAVWMNGERRWRRLLFKEAERYSDIVWRNDNLYALRTYHGFAVEVWDFNRTNTSSNVCLCTMKYRIVDGLGWGGYTRVVRLLARSTGEVLVVAYYPGKNKWKAFLFEEDLSEQRFARLRSINGQALVIVHTEWEGSINLNYFCISSIDVQNFGYKANSVYLVKCEGSSDDTFERKMKVSNYSLEDEQVEVVWESYIPFGNGVDVKLQPLGLFSLNITSCAQLCSRWSKVENKLMMN